MDVSARNMLRLIDRVYSDGRDVATREDVMSIIMRADLGADGFRAVKALPSGYFTKDEMKSALTIALFSND
jgi:hypothetical protein